MNEQKTFHWSLTSAPVSINQNGSYVKGTATDIHDGSTLYYVLGTFAAHGCFFQTELSYRAVDRMLQFRVVELTENKPNLLAINNLDDERLTRVCYREQCESETWPALERAFVALTGRISEKEYPLALTNNRYVMDHLRDLMATHWSKPQRAEEGELCGRVEKGFSDTGLYTRSFVHYLGKRYDLLLQRSASTGHGYLIQVKLSQSDPRLGADLLGADKQGNLLNLVVPWAGILTQPCLAFEYHLIGVMGGFEFSLLKAEFTRLLILHVD